MKEVEQEYIRTQQQQYAKKQAEKYERISKNSLDKENQQKYRGLADRWKSRAYDWNMSKFTDMLQDYNNGQKDVISHWSIQRNLNKTGIGKQTVEYIVKHPELNIHMCYKVDATESILGFQEGNDIFIYASKTKTIQKTAETLIHEITHHRYNIGDSQWAECVCRVQEFMHRNNVEKLTAQELRDIIKSVNKDYPELKWR